MSEFVCQNGCTQRIRKLEAENATFRNAQKACETCDAPTIAEFKEMKATLRAVAELPEKWRNLWETMGDNYRPLDEQECADELEALLREQSDE